MSTEDNVHRFIAIKVQEFLLVSSLPTSNDDNQAEKKKEIACDILEALDQLRTPEGRARDAEYFQQNGGVLTVATDLFMQWKSQLVIGEPPTPVSPAQSEQPEQPLRPTTPPSSDTNLLRLSLDQNKLFVSDLKKAYESFQDKCDPSPGNPQEIKLKLGQCDIFTPFLAAHVGVYDGRYKYHDVLVAASRFFLAGETNTQINVLARGIVLADAANAAAREYAAVDPRGAAYDALANLSDDKDNAPSNPLHQEPLAIAARKAANAFLGRGGEKSKAWISMCKLKGPCKTQAFLVAITVVQIKTIMLISVEMWKEKFEGATNRTDFFKDLEALGNAITGKSILGLSIAGLIEDVLVEGTFRKLSLAHANTLSQCWNNLNEDMTSKVWLPQYGIAEADSLILDNPSEPWTPPAVTQPIPRPYLSKDDKSMDMYRRTGVRLIVYTPRCLNVSEVLVESGYPKSRVLDLALALLCTSPTELGHSTTYSFIMDDYETIRAAAAQHLRPAGPSKKDKGGPITKILTTFDNKTEKFRNHHIFSNLLNDIQRGTTETLDLFAAHFQVLEEFVTSEGGNEDDGGEADENEYVQV